MNAITFPLTANCNEASNRMRSMARRMGPLTQGEMILIDSVRRALASGLFYTSEVLAFVVADLKVTEEAQAIQTKHVEGGLIGMEAYYARGYLEDVQDREDNDEAAKNLGLHSGQKLPQLMFSDRKMNSACIVFEVGARGRTAKIAAKRGKQVIHIDAKARDILRAIERAAEHKAERKKS